MRIATYTEKDKDKLLEKLREYYRKHGTVPVGSSFSPGHLMYTKDFLEVGIKR